MDHAFRAALPAGVDNYAAEILNAEAAFGVSRWLLAGIMMRESNGGLTLTPRGPAGTGDPIPRKPYTDSGQPSRYLPFMNPATGMPIDGLGWGRGLMQIDYGAHNAWVTSANWADPQTNINKAASLLAADKATLLKNGVPESQLTPYLLAAYNAGAGQALKAFRAGQPADTVTWGKNYSTWVLTRVAAWEDAYRSASA